VIFFAGALATLITFLRDITKENITLIHKPENLSRMPFVAVKNAGSGQKCEAASCLKIIINDYF